MSKEILTLQKLKDMEPFAIIATGITTNPILHNEPVRWVAKRGEIYDWALYYHYDFNTVQYVMEYGDKCFTKSVIKELVPCDEEAFNMYRF